MQAKFVKFVPLKKGDVSVMLTTTDADIPELVTFLRKDVSISLVQGEIQEDKTALLQNIKVLLEEIRAMLDRDKTAC